MYRLLGGFTTNESGATAIEYGLIAALIVLAIIGTLTAVNEHMIELYDYIFDTISEAFQNAGI